ncbi:hypothetical protein BABINDRAFT_6566 [Babjeviella inositovora NRRL Y-12698]|uniref:ubiquitinyl hydrolase 1 n=1 Tax=Babjeviella inositovora NRRL Y-12698 TaxID=984486 RepID=A0A1E3QW94_9ASCO|nr:uncharacterized protein BABINDRAFT_6566 [Babjeviella inositovora NRRL Y-12698]ODQ81939.1 hypothetical protein BABINDRAFT_6566 [Babjeviella inositovora NRRL Y-12698]
MTNHEYSIIPIQGVSMGDLDMPDVATSPSVPSPDISPDAALPTPPYAPISQLVDLPDKAPPKILISDQDLATSVFKTSDRIVSDILYDIPHILSHEAGLLGQRPIAYSHFLSSIAGMHYEMNVLNNALPEAPKSEDLASVKILRGVLASKTPGSSIYHVKILYQVHDRLKICPKHTFYTVSDERLSLLRPSFCWEIDQGATTAQLTVLTKAMPKILDSATFCCSNCSTVFRAEISAPEFGKDLADFTPEAIAARYESLGEDSPVPTPDKCLYTLYKVLKGPLLQAPTDEVKSIHADNLLLRSHLDLRLLFDKLFFTQHDGELYPPNLHEYLEDNLRVLRESYLRKMNETLYLGRQTGSTVPLFQSLTYNTNNALLFALFNERDFSKSVLMLHEPANLTENYLNLSVSSHYDDRMVMECHQRTALSDDPLVYFDNVYEIAESKFYHSTVLRRYITELNAAGAMGMKAYQKAARDLGVDAPQLTALPDDLLLAMYRTEVGLDPVAYYRLRASLEVINKVRKSRTISEFCKTEIIPYEVALTNLGYEASTDDEFVLNTCLMQAEAGVPDAERSVLSVVLHRRNPRLLSFLENNYSELMRRLPGLTLGEAARMLDLPDVNVSDSEVITAFERCVLGKEETFQCLVLRRALYVLQNVSGSKFLMNYLQTGQIEKSLLPPSETWPRGLDNIGNTCYLNSLLQYFFALKPLRDAVLTFHAFDPAEPALQKVLAERKVGNRNITAAETRRAFEFLHHFRVLYLQMIESQEKSITLNKSFACLALASSFEEIRFADEAPGEAMEIELEDLDRSDSTDIARPEVKKVKQSPFNPFRNSPVPLMVAESGASHEDLATKSDVDEASAHVDETPETAQVDDTPETDAEPTTETDITKADAVPLNLEYPQPREVLINDFDSQVGRQQDVGEVIDNVVFWFQCALKPDTLDADGYQCDLITKLFDGRYRKVTDKTPACDKRQYLTVNVVGYQPRDIYDALQNLMDEEAWVVEELPEVLQIQVARVYYDNGVQKSSAQLPFYEQIYMDRYLESGDDTMVAKKGKHLEWKKDLEVLKTRQAVLKGHDDNGLTPRESLVHVMEWISKCEESISPETLAVLQRKIDNLEIELTRIDQDIQKLQIDMDGQFREYTKCGYTLFAIFIHRGGASYGHYWIYIRDLKSGIYRKYSDDRVEEVSEAEVLDFSVNNTATANCIVYVRDDLSAEYIDPIKRKTDNAADL